MSDIVERLREYASDDHERGCQGRCYDCSCGYDAKRDPLMIEAADRIAQLEAEVHEHALTCRAIPDEFALVPPDGGDVKPWEAVSEMANTITRYREALSILSDHWKHGYGGPTRADVIRAVQDISRTALGEDRT